MERAAGLLDAKILDAISIAILQSRRLHIFSWSRYAIAPAIQIIALIVYGAMTVRITSLLDFNIMGSQGDRSFLKLGIGSPNTITVSHFRFNLDQLAGRYQLTTVVVAIRRTEH